MKTLKKKPSQVRIYAEGLDHPEGLAVDAEGQVWCGGENGQVYRISVDQKKVETVAQVGGFCLGFAFSPEGELFLCNHKIPAILRLNPLTLQWKVFSDEVAGQKVRVPNHLVFDRLGNMYVSDSGEWGKSTGLIYRFDSRGAGVVWYQNLAYANGVALDPEQENLYVVQTCADNVLKIPIASNGQAKAGKVYVDGLAYAPDGLVFDSKNRLYVCCYGNSRIYQVSPSGRKRILIEDRQGILLNRPTNMIYRKEPREELLISNLGGYHLTSLTW
jgi:gluconolactonase